MPSPVSDPARAYRRAQVQTASPVELRLLLLEAAVTAHAAARAALAERTLDAFVEHLQHGQRVLLELDAGLDRDANPELAATLSALTMYAYRESVTACMERDDARLANVIGLLEHERETWRAWQAIRTGAGDGSERVDAVA